MASYVLDSTALTTLLRREPGYEKVLPHIYGAMFSSVNMAEVLALCLASGAKLEDCRCELAKLQFIEVSFDQEQAEVVAGITASNEGAVLSFPDLAALSLGLTRKATVLTRSEQMKMVKPGPKVKLIT